jgi:rhamnose utilization protein RhaD (predicted bifunctional aldolase and dehydrogenase)/NAD(P)-dependent dehydrogenase (short-subunit alcohol dehydrogenase family)
MRRVAQAATKGRITTLTGDEVEALFVKASGVSMDEVMPPDFVCLDNAYCKRLRALGSLADELMAQEFRLHLLRPHDALPSIETLMHAFIDRSCVMHTHPSAVLALTNRTDGEKAVTEALGGDTGILPYVNAGLGLARAVADLIESKKGFRAVVVMHHGLVAWGAAPKQAYDNTVEIVNRAEEYLARSRRRAISVKAKTTVEAARGRYVKVAPILRGLLSPFANDPDNDFEKMVLAPLITRETLELLDSSNPPAGDIACTVPLTPDYLVRTKARPLLVDSPSYEDDGGLRRQLAGAVASYSASYGAYVKKCSSRLAGFDASDADLLPRVVLLPGCGALCAGRDIHEAQSVADITEQTLNVKRVIYETGGSYLGLTEDHLFDMEFRAFQRAKVEGPDQPPLRGATALVTGAAGAIGSGICEGLLSQGCNVVITDLAGKRLDAMVSELKGAHSGRVIGAALDVTSGDSVRAAFESAVEAFGGIDIVVINAGLAHVSSLVEMDTAAFRKLEQVNIEGTLFLLSEAGRLFKQQNMGGDIVLVSTKNVFAPGAKFGAYSATKAAAHQLCRIASLEFADMGVRVNMVSPDAVFSHGDRKSGLWAQVGPDRMKARGLDEKGLEDYYRQRNLLKARVTAGHVAAAVLFFVTRQTPTTGATIPVDGGLPDATPR